MANEIRKITSLNTGTVDATNLYPAVDVNDTTQATTGTTKKYSIGSLFTYFAAALDLSPYTPVVAATTVNLNATYNNGASGVNATLTNAGALAAFTLDGVTGVLNDRYLVKDQTTEAYNGIYTLTTVGSATVAWVLTRAVDCNTGSGVSQNIIDGKTVFVNKGTVNANSFYQLSCAATVTVGTDALVWSLFTFTPPTPPSNFDWILVSGTTQSMAVNKGYIADNAGLVTLTLPATANVGDVVRISGLGAGGWKLAQNAGQTIHIGNLDTSTGVLGYLSSTNRHDAVELVCTDNNNEFNVISMIGNLTVF